MTAWTLTLSAFLFTTIFFNTSQCALSQNHEEKKCIAQRAVFDIGSGATKFHIAEVDTCAGKIVRMIANKYVPAQYQQALIASGDAKRFDTNTQQHGLKIINELSKLARRTVHPTQMCGIATAAFRTARNAQEFLNYIKQKTGIKIHRISQKQEALLGLKAAKSHPEVAHLKTPIVWDIGGGSQQIITEKDQDLLYLGGELASESFKKLVIEHIKKSTADNPNPLSWQQVLDAIALAKNHIKFPLKTILKLNKALDDAGHVIVGIGAVHLIAKKDSNPGAEPFYTREHLLAALRKFANQSDIEVKKNSKGNPAYSGNVLTNMILLYAMMEALNVEKVYVFPINTADGLLVEGCSMLTSPPQGQTLTYLNLQD